ncbi:hypothetical protein D9M68_271960 [compost metagenome]
MALDEALRVAVEGQPAAHDGLAGGAVDVRGEAHEQAEAVEQLRAQLALLRVHGADQGDARRMLVGDAVALDAVHAAGADVEQQVDQTVGEQVDLVDVQHAAVGARQQAGLEGDGAALQRGLQVQRAEQLLLAGAQRQVDEAAVRQQLGQSPGAGRLGGAARPLDQHAADLRVDGGEQQRQLQLRLAVQGGEGVLRGHGHRSSRCCSAASRCCSICSR